jgi:hypothetical protein
LGQQQLLLIVVAIIVVGIAIAISIMLFKSNAIESKRDILIEETSTLATMAIEYYKKPRELGGGGRTFTDWQIPPQMVNTYNGNFMTASITADNVEITGTGTEVVTGTDSIKVITYVSANDFYTEIIN